MHLRPYEPAPLWGSDDVWREANDTVSYLLRRHSNGLKRTVAYARAVREELSAVFTCLDNLCLRSCPWCPEPCCLSAKIWFDFKDLLFLHLTASPIPPAPLLVELTGVCWYFGPKGCLLDRISRPWICIWYLCPTQLAILRRQGRSDIQTIDRAFLAIKAGRAKMESEFIHLIS